MTEASTLILATPNTPRRAATSAMPAQEVEIKILVSDYTDCGLL